MILHYDYFLDNNSPLANDKTKYTQRKDDIKNKKLYMNTQKQ